MTQMRTVLPFRAVNVPGRQGYRAGLQRHHLLPRQVFEVAGLADLIAQMGAEALGFDDFSRNGLLLPATDDEALRLGLPLHRGPHQSYNELVIERIGQIEAGWQKRRRGADDEARAARLEALMRLDLLQRALRRRLLDSARLRPMALNRRDPALDFSHLDRLADMLWAATAPAA